MKSIQLMLDWPPSINYYYMRSNRGMYLHKRVKEYRSLIEPKARVAKGLFAAEDRLRVSIKLFGPNKRKFDIDNRVKGLIDSLECCGVFENDEQIDFLMVERAGIVKGGAVLVTIEQALL